MSNYLPNELKDLRTRFRLIKMTTTKVLGADKITEEEIGQFYGNFKSRGGTEIVQNGKIDIEDTAEIVTFWRPDIQSDCKVVNMETNAKYEIIGEPEDFGLSHQGLKFKVKRLKGKFNG